MTECIGERQSLVFQCVTANSLEGQAVCLATVLPISPFRSVLRDVLNLE